MLKTTLAIGPTALAVGLIASAEVGNEEQNGKGIQVDGDEKEPA